MGPGAGAAKIENAPCVIASPKLVDPSGAKVTQASDTPLGAVTTTTPRCVVLSDIGEGRGNTETGHSVARSVRTGPCLPNYDHHVERVDVSARVGTRYEIVDPGSQIGARIRVDPVREGVTRHARKDILIRQIGRQRDGGRELSRDLLAERIVRARSRPAGSDKILNECIRRTRIAKKFELAFP